MTTVLRRTVGVLVIFSAALVGMLMWLWATPDATVVQRSGSNVVVSESLRAAPVEDTVLSDIEESEIEPIDDVFTEIDADLQGL